MTVVVESATTVVGVIQRGSCGSKEADKVDQVRA